MDTFCARASSSALQVRRLKVIYQQKTAPVVAVRNASLHVNAGEIIGVLGESGCGKTTLGLALLRILPANAEFTCDCLRVRGVEIANLSDRELERLRGAWIAMVSQEPALSLNPVIRVGEQLSEIIRAHRGMPSSQRKARVIVLLGELGFQDPNTIFRAYPHQLSGGERQRIAIAQALACSPAVVIADEPTSKLDASLRREILQLFVRFRERYRTAFLIISHDLAALAAIADRILVMYGGEIVEEGTTEAILENPLHPYTQALIRVVRAGRGGDGRRFPAIPGEPPDLAASKTGCCFEPRCSERMPVCKTCEPHAIRPTAAAERLVSCLRYGE